MHYVYFTVLLLTSLQANSLQNISNTNQSQSFTNDSIAQLQAMFQGKLPSQVQIQSLFSIELDDFNAVTQRVKELEKEQLNISAQHVTIEQRIKNLEAELPQTQKPKILDQPEPTLPEGINQEMLEKREVPGVLYHGQYLSLYV